MGRVNAAIQAMNRGTVSKLALARTDVDRLRLSAEIQTNWLPRTLGPMMLRPGLGYTGSNTLGDQPCKVIPFIYSAADTAAMEFTPGYLRVLIDDAPVERPTVGTVVSDFTSSGAWVLAATGGGAVSTISAATLELNLGSEGGTATATQAVTLPGTSSGIEHAIRIIVKRGPVRFRVGTSSGSDDLVADAVLDTGTHSIAFTPTTNFYVQFEGLDRLQRLVESCAIEAAGVMTLPTTYGASDLAMIRSDQSADVVFLACAGQQQRKIERRSRRSWAFVEYKTNDGPFTSSADGSISITPLSTRGNTSMTASRPLFHAGHVGALFQLTHSGQNELAGLSADDTYSDAIRVTGVTSGRIFNLAIFGTWTGTITLQRSFDSESAGFTDYQTYTANTATAIDDDLDNSIVWYRLGFKTGDYGSGTADVSLSFPGGSGTGVARVYAFHSSTNVSIEVLTEFSNTTATFDWREGSWSDYRGWPTSVIFHEGRLWWVGNDRFWGSVSDNYTSFNPETEGDSGPIDRTIGQGPIATINWLQSTQRLIAGADASIIQAKSSSFDEPLTPTNFNLKAFSTQGAATLPAVKVDTRVVYVQQSGRRVYQVLFDVQINDYTTKDLTRLNEEVGVPGFVDIAVQRQPDTSIHFASGAGTAEVLLFDQDDGVEAWWKIETDGVIENVYVLPGTLEDQVYCVVRRDIGGVAKRYHEKFARLDECQGGTLNKQADCFLVYSGSATTTIPGLDHLEGREVVVWADGLDLSPGIGDTQTTYTVTGGTVALATPVSNAVIGLPYAATFKSSKLAYGAQLGTALTQHKRLDHLGLILGPTHPKGLYFGDTEDNMDPLPEVEGGQVVDPNVVREEYDEAMIELAGAWSTDSRLVLKAYAPRPATVMACITAITTNG